MTICTSDIKKFGIIFNPEGYVVATVSTVGTVKGDAGVALQKFPEYKIIIKIIK